MQEGLQRALAAAELRGDAAEARAASTEAKVSDDAAPIAHLKLQIAKLQRAERGQRLLDQYKLQLRRWRRPPPLMSCARR